MQTESYATGWLCPRCKKINAPWSSQCTCYMGEYKITCTGDGGTTTNKIQIEPNPWGNITTTTPYKPLGEITTTPYNPFTDVYYNTTATTATDATIKTGEKNRS